MGKNTNTVLVYTCEKALCSRDNEPTLLISVDFSAHQLSSAVPLGLKIIWYISLMQISEQASLSHPHWALPVLCFHIFTQSFISSCILSPMLSPTENTPGLLFPLSPDTHTFNFYSQINTWHNLCRQEPAAFSGAKAARYPHLEDRPTPQGPGSVKHSRNPTQCITASTGQTHTQVRCSLDRTVLSSSLEMWVISEVCL